ncbi:uncharacterized protein F4817DRAFT_324761 [Daldinia loculata]|uniref:uncharacterized protein n=1 Tax=Daldinia loculata TaxID=103429 RepID=UPI0020C5411A|nr:uncharacterized protein F4817DRAFT_324761 [Daldinia loculata]KAI1651504.1 hypothetical protein F4817DRAFT_324761 [Daldinia loculata]
MFPQRRPLASTSRSAESSQHRSDRRTQSSRRRDSSREKRRVELVDLDDIFTERNPVKITFKTWQLHDVHASLKKRFPEGAQEIPEDAEVQFFSDNKRLEGDDIPKDSRLLFYRVLREGDDGSFRVVWRGTSVKLRKPEREAIAREATMGKSVGSLREIVANLLRDTNKSKEGLVQNANQIVIETEAGLEQRLLEGNSWEVRKAMTWLCRYLIISMKPVDSYFVLQGFNEQYICHKPCLNRRGYADTLKLKNWLKNEVLATVHSDNKVRRRHINFEDIKLTYNGKPVTRASHIRPGATIDFEVPRSIEDKFVRAESWLVPTSETCIVCGDEKRVSEMPNRKRITAACEHDATTCKACVGLWIASSLERITWDRLKCPECPKLLKFENVRAFASREIFDKYDMLATKALLARIPEFMWCLNPGCESGQIHPAGCSKAKCHGCRGYVCIHHNVPWHKGETCDEYDKRTRKQRKNDEASEKHIKEMSKPCPGCKRNINKYIGCDHVTCICGHEWCWLCFEPYYKDEQDFLQCHHSQECRYHDNPPNYEGGRAFMPFMNAPPRPHVPIARQREPRQNFLFPIRPRNRPPEPRPNPGPVPPAGDEEGVNRLRGRRGGLDLNPFNPAPDINRARRQRFDLPPELIDEAMMLHLGHLMHGTGRN